MRVLLLEEEKMELKSSYIAWTATLSAYPNDADRVKLMKMMRRELETVPGAVESEVYGLQWCGAHYYVYKMTIINRSWALMQVLAEG